MSTEEGKVEFNPPTTAERSREGVVEIPCCASRMVEANGKDGPINSTDNPSTSVSDGERMELNDDTKVAARDLTAAPTAVTDNENTASTSALEMMEEGRDNFARGAESPVLPTPNEEPASALALETIGEGKEVVNGSLETSKIPATPATPPVVAPVATPAASLEMIEEGRESREEDNDTMDVSEMQTAVASSSMTCNELFWQYIRLVVHLILFPLMILISLAVPILIVVFCFALTLVTMLIYCCTPRGAEHSGVPFHVLVRQLLDAVDDDYDYHKPKYTRSEIEDSLLQRKLLRIIDHTDEEKDDNGDDEEDDPLNEKHHDYMFPASTAPGEQALANTTNQSLRLSKTRIHFVTRSRRKPIDGVGRVFIFSKPMKTNQSTENKKDGKPTQNADMPEDDDDSGILSQENCQVCTNSGTDLLGSFQNTTRNSEDVRNQLPADADDAPGNLLGGSTSSSHSNITYPELEQLDTRWNGSYEGHSKADSPRHNLTVKGGSDDEESTSDVTNQKRSSTSAVVVSRDPVQSGTIKDPIVTPQTNVIAGGTSIIPPVQNSDNLVASIQVESSTAASRPPDSLENHFDISRDIECTEKHDNNQQLESEENDGPYVEVTIGSSIDDRTTERPTKSKIEEKSRDSTALEHQCVPTRDIFGNFNERGTATYCTICLLEYKEGDMVAWSSNCDACDHAFHVDCLLDWLQRNITCPNCRQDYVSSVSESNDVAPELPPI